MKNQEAGLQARLQGLKPPAYLLIHGDELLLQLEIADSIRAWLRSAGFTGRERVEVDRHFKLEQLAHLVQSKDLFASAKIIEMRFGAKPHKAAIDWLTAWAPQSDGQVCVMLSCARLDKSQLGMAWFRDLQAAGWAFEAATIPRAGLAAWIRQRMISASLKANDEVIELIASRTEGNLLASAQEIKKLAMLGPTDITLTLAQQTLADSARWGAFDLQASCLLGDRQRSLKILEGLLAVAEPAPLILWALADAARQLQALHECLQAGLNRSQAFRQLRIYASREAVFHRALDRISMAQSMRLLALAARTDRCIKGLGGNAQEALRDFVLACTAKSPAADRLLAAQAWGAG